ncbi:MAG: PrsW family glutamic-type intramembrane protease [Chloroflexota bacterium]|nr:PrsW family glutamic-type intramembrane protease [Chloroflexota bacterium]
MEDKIPQVEPKRENQRTPPREIDRWAKALVTLWGTALFLPALPLAPAFCCLLAEAFRYDDSGARAFGLGAATLMVVGLACGGTMLFQGSSSLVGKPSKRLRLPPLWGVLGGFVLALVTGMGLGQVEGLSLLLGPWFIVAAAALPPLAAVVWAVDERPGGLTWRRAGVAFSAGATVSVILAIILEILAPLSILWLLLDLSDPVLNALEGLVDLLAGGQVANALSSPGFLLALFELAVVAPLVEEFAKSLVVLPLLRGTKSRRDVFLLGAMAGAGFAVVENVLYALFSGRYWGGILLVRALGAAVHPLGTGLMALAWHSFLGRNQVVQKKPGFCALAVGQHALWNGGLVLWMALSGAAFFGPQPWEADVMGISIAVGMLALVALEGAALWVGMRALSRRLDPAKAPGGEELGLSTERAIALWAVACLVALLPVGMAVLRGLWAP